MRSLAHPAFQQQDHRPSPVPRGPWVMKMSWQDLLFAHWPVPADELCEHLPPGLELDLFEGEAWLGLVPFRMTGVRPRLLPGIPGTAAFPELNLRTYVTAPENGAQRPGVWFFSLDATSKLAVRAARATYHVPYFDARMTCEPSGESGVRYTHRRTHRGAPPAAFEADYAPLGDPELAQPGSLEHWLLERYCLYGVDRRRRPYRAHIHHIAWPMQRAEAEIRTNAMTEQIGVTLPDCEPLLHFARRVDVVAWTPRRHPIPNPVY